MPDPIRFPATPTEAFRMGTLLQQQGAIQAQLNALTAAAAKRLELHGSGHMEFATDTAEWVVTPSVPRADAPGGQGRTTLRTVGIDLGDAQVNDPNGAWAEE